MRNADGVLQFRKHPVLRNVPAKWMIIRRFDEVENSNSGTDWLTQTARKSLDRTVTRMSYSGLPDSGIAILFDRSQGGATHPI